jgi:hypothetical protein
MTVLDISMMNIGIPGALIAAAFLPLCASLTKLVFRFVHCCVHCSAHCCAIAARAAAPLLCLLLHTAASLLRYLCILLSVHHT